MSHEDLNREQEVESSSNRSFGFVFTVVFLLIALWPLFYKEGFRWWACGVALGFGLLAIFRPTLLSGLNRLWTKLGLLLGKIVSPVALGIVFYAVLTPLGIAMRLTGKDPLRLKLDPDARTYWIPRDPPGPPPDSMTNQF